MLLSTAVAGWIAGCTATEAGTARELPDPSSPIARDAFLRTDASSLRVATGQVALFEARYVSNAGLPLADEPVRFALIGDSGDSSLTFLDWKSDKDGRIVNGLRAGHQAADFQIRITATRAEAAFVDVEVAETGFGNLHVRITQSKRRAPDHWTVAAYRDSDCGSLDNSTETRAVSLSPGDGEAVLVALPAGAQYAVEVKAWGAADTLLSHGCSDAIDLPREVDTTVTVATRDEPIDSKGVYQVELECSTPRLADHLARYGHSAAAQQLAAGRPPARAEASILLDALESTLTEIGHPSDLDALVRERQSRDLDSKLQAALGARQQGVEAALAFALDRAQEALSEITLSSRLQVTPAPSHDRWTLRWEPQTLRVPPSDSTASAQVAVPAAVVTADSTARPSLDLIEMGELTLGLAFGALATQVTAGVLGVHAPRSLAQSLRQRLGCGTLHEHLTQRALFMACDAMCLRAACRDVQARLEAALAQAWNRLDRQGHSTTLRGDWLVNDTDGDLVGDELLSDEFVGAWGPAGAGWLNCQARAMRAPAGR